MKYSRSKLKKHNCLLKHSGIKPALPDTASFSEKHFYKFINKYGKVIVKPSNSWGGRGVISIAHKGGQTYEMHSEKAKRKILGHKAIYKAIKKKTKGQPYIVQRRIPLAKVKDKPFDIRIMIQRKTGSKKWKVTGMLAKVAGSGYMITNVARSKGYVLPVSKAIKKSNIHRSSADSLEAKMKKLAVKSAKHLKKYYRIHTVGLDVGLDSKGKVWIIEANFTPSRSLFKKLKDKSMYRKIKSYQ